MLSLFRRIKQRLGSCLKSRNEKPDQLVAAGCRAATAIAVPVAGLPVYRGSAQRR